MCISGISASDAPETCRNDRKLNESPLVPRGGSTGAGAGSEPFFLRSRCAHENSPDGFFGAGCGSMAALPPPLRPSVVLLRGRPSMLPLCGAGVRAASVRSVGSDRVERALWGSP